MLNRILLIALARAKTGSGKTIAYVLPILESILRRKAVCMSLTYLFYLILTANADRPGE